MSCAYAKFGITGTSLYVYPIMPASFMIASRNNPFNSHGLLITAYHREASLGLGKIMCLIVLGRYLLAEPSGLKWSALFSSGIQP